MAYTLWTGKGLELYNSYLKNIDVEQIGFINIGGIFEKPDLITEHHAAAYIFRIYDNNVNCPDRKSNIAGPGIQRMMDGRIAGLVVTLAKDKDTGDFFFDNKAVDSNKITIAHPASVWIATHYTGECEIIGTQVVYEHQGKFHELCCTINNQGQPEVALRKEHIIKFILPTVAKSYEDEILKADMNRGYMF